MATGDRCTSPPATMVPVRSLITTRADTDRVHVDVTELGQQLDRLILQIGGRFHFHRAAVEGLGRCLFRRPFPTLPPLFGRCRSPGVRSAMRDLLFGPERGLDFTFDERARGHATGGGHVVLDRCCPMRPPRRSHRRRGDLGRLRTFCDPHRAAGVCTKTPPRSDLALPIEDTVTSKREPSRTKAGIVAVTTTAATLRKRACLASILNAQAAHQRSARTAVRRAP